MMHGPIKIDGDECYYDLILEKFVPTSSIVPDHPYKLQLLEDLRPMGELKEVEHQWILKPVSAEKPTVVLCTSGNPKTSFTCMRTACMFTSLGFAVLPMAGFDPEAWPPNKPKMAGRKGHLAWLLCFLPKLAKLTSGREDSDYFLIAEDSCWPTTDCTPENIRKTAREKGNLWLGYRNHSKPERTNLKQIIDMYGNVVNGAKKVRSVYGLKLLVLNPSAIRLLRRAFCKLHPNDYTAETYFKMLGCQYDHGMCPGCSYLHVEWPPLACCCSHYSLVDGQWNLNHNFPQKVQPNLLPLRDIVQDMA